MADPYHLGGDGPFTAEQETIYDLPRFRAVFADRQMGILSRFMAPRDFRSTLAPFQLLLRTIPFRPEQGVELLFCDCMPHLLNLYLSLPQAGAEPKQVRRMRARGLGQRPGRSR